MLKPRGCNPWALSGFSECRPEQAPRSSGKATTSHPLPEQRYRSFRPTRLPQVGHLCERRNRLTVKISSICACSEREIRQPGEDCYEVISRLSRLRLLLLVDPWHRSRYQPDDVRQRVSIPRKIHLASKESQISESPRPPSSLRIRFNSSTE